MDRTLSSAEWAEWLAYDRVEGIPHPWRQTGVIAAVTAAPYRRRGSPAPKPEDFMPIQRSRRQTTAEMKAVMRSFSTRYRGLKDGSRRKYSHWNDG